MVRLVRACGSKRQIPVSDTLANLGQARKSLWIETGDQYQNQTYGIGQARKSLWIETLFPKVIFIRTLGQARKSLWIETPRMATSV